MLLRFGGPPISSSAGPLETACLQTPRAFVALLCTLYKAPYKFSRFSQPLAFSHCVLLPLKQEETERSATATREFAPPKATGRGNTRSSGARTVTAEIQAPKDKTALEIAANEALFGGGADEPWGLALSSTGGSVASWGVADSSSWHGNSSTSATQATAAATGGDFFTRGTGNHNPRTSGKGKTVRKAKGGGDALPLLASANGSSMGSYDRDAHLRMQMPHPPPATATAKGMGSHQLPTHRVKAASGNNLNTGPYFHHFLDRSSTANSSTNSLLFNPSNSFPDTTSNTLGKRPRSSNNGNFSSSFGGYPSPPPFDADHPLPDFITNWGFTSRAGTKGNNSASSAPVLCSSSATTTSSHSSSNATTSSSLSGMGSPNAASMFAGVDSFLPDYDSSLYSLWTAPGGYDTENDATQGQQQQQVQPPPLYMTSEDELKLDYPQLPEFNQDLDSYLNDPMDAGGPSPTTPHGTTSSGNNNGMMKMDHLDRRTHLTTGTHVDRLLAPAAATATAEYLVRRVRGLENTSRRSVKRSRGAFDDAYAAAPVSGGAVTGSSASSFKNAPIEPKRALMPSLGSFQPGTSLLMPTSAILSQVETPSSAAKASTTIVTPTSDTASSKGSKRPRSRQCEFPGCQNRARSHQKCKKHGGAHQCVFEGCTKNSQSRGLCIAHGGGSRCTREGCVRAAQSKGLCKSHGGGEYCAVEGCHKKAHLKHLCRTHGGGVRCKIDKCSKWAQRKGWCMAHAKEFSATS